MVVFYSPKEKARAIQLLVENLGNTRLTAEETGIPERTIQRWRNEYSPTTILMSNDHDESLEALVRDRYVQIRNTLIDHVQRLSKQMYEFPETTADLSMAYVRLVDRLLKAEQLASVRSFQLVILYEDPEGNLRDLYDSDLPF
jgi:transposase-like protein